MKTFILEANSPDNLEFLGYHSSKKNMKDGYYMGDVLDTRTYGEVIRSAYLDIVGDDYRDDDDRAYRDEYDDEYDDDDRDYSRKMNQYFEDNGYGFTFVSKYPIKASAYQYTKYKYGDYLYKVHGTGYEIMLNDPNELQAYIIVSKTPLYFEKQEI